MGTLHLSSKQRFFTCTDNLEQLCGFPINALFGLDNGSIFDLLLQRTNLCKELSRRTSLILPSVFEPYVLTKERCDLHPISLCEMDAAIVAVQFCA